jgi:hypothetical protein
MHPSIKRILFIGACLAALLAGHTAHAQNRLLQVTVSTSALISDSADEPFSLDFQWVNPITTTGHPPSTDDVVTLSNFTFGGGSAINTGGSIYRSGPSVTGSLGSTISLDDTATAGTYEFAQEFNPGSTLTFNLSIPTTGQPGNTPEAFYFAIQNENDVNLATTAPDATGSLVEASVPNAPNLTNTAITVTSYQTKSPAPTGVVATAVPEPGTYSGLCLGMLVLVALGRKMRRARA